MATALAVYGCAKEPVSLPPRKSVSGSGIDMTITFDTTPWVQETLYFCPPTLQNVVQ